MATPPVETPSAAPTRRGRPPRNAALPGLETREIQALDEVALEYAEVRDRRMALNQEEADLKARAMSLMHQHHKTVYRRDGIEIEIVPGEETIKVRVKPPKDTDEGEEEA